MSKNDHSDYPKYKINDREYRCPFQLTTSVIEGKWRLKIVKSLHDNGRLRYGQLKKKLYEEITHKMLIQSLKQLEADGMVTRMVYKEVPPRVEYQLTERGMELNGVIEAMNEFGKKYVVTPISFGTNKRR